MCTWRPITTRNNSLQRRQNYCGDPGCRWGQRSPETVDTGRVPKLYLQVNLYISSGVCGRGSVFFFEPGLERGLTALQSNAGRENVCQSFVATFTGGDNNQKYLNLNYPTSTRIQFQPSTIIYVVIHVKPFVFVLFPYLLMTLFSCTFIFYAPLLLHLFLQPIVHPSPVPTG